MTVKICSVPLSSVSSESFQRGRQCPTQGKVKHELDDFHQKDIFT